MIEHAVCLIMLLDSSGSISAEEWTLQAEATADALRSPEIVAAMLSGPHRSVALAAVEWSSSQTVIVPWTAVASDIDAGRVADAIAAHRPRNPNGSTAVGDALIAAATMMQTAPECLRRTVDISSDGVQNAGAATAAQGVATLLALGVEVNAIVIEDGDQGVVEFYEALVTGFVRSATWDGYKQAIKAKLTLEIAGITPGAVPLPRWTERERDWRTYWWPHATEFWSVGAQHDGRPDPACNCHHWTPPRETPVPDSLFLLAVGLMLLGVIGWSWRRR